MGSILNILYDKKLYFSVTKATVVAEGVGSVETGGGSAVGWAAGTEAEGEEAA